MDTDEPSRASSKPAVAYTDMADYDNPGWNPVTGYRPLTDDVKPQFTGLLAMVKEDASGVLPVSTESLASCPHGEPNCSYGSGACDCAR